MQHRFKALCAAAAAVSLGLCASANATLSFYVEPNGWPSDTQRQAAVNAMQNVVNRYNAYGDFGNYTIYVDYNSGVPTAQAGYLWQIDFGGTWPNDRVAQHESNHYLGSGTTDQWNNMWDSNGIWTGSHMSALILQFDGDGAAIKHSGVHFYPYGLNYDSEVSDIDGAIGAETVYMRNIALMYAQRQDDGLGNQAIPWSATSCTLKQSDASGTSAFNNWGVWSDNYFAHSGAAYSTGNYTLRTPLDTYSPTGATPSFTFAGDSLTINNTNGSNGGLLFKGVGTSSVITIKNLILDGGYLRHASGSGDLFQLAGGITLKGTSTIDAAQGNIKILSNIGGNGNLNVSGGYTTTLAGTNSYTGTTRVNSGVLAFTAAPSNIGGVTVANGAALQVRSLGGASTTVTSSSLTLGSTGGSTSLAFDLNTMDTTAPLISTGVLTANGTVNVTIQNSGALDIGSHPLIGYTSFSGAGTFSSSPITIDPRTTGTLVNNGANALSLNVTGDRPVWSGDDNGTWAVGATGSSKNWKLRTAGTATDYIQGDNVLFDDSATGAATINIGSANVSPARITFNNPSKNYTLASSGGYGIAGSGSLIKNGGGTVTMATANTYTGTTTINAGTISISSNNNLGADSAPVTLNGGALKTTAGITNTHPITVGSAGGTINVTTSGQYYFNTANALTGSGDLTVTGTGTLLANTGNLRVEQTNSYSGALTAKQGGIFEYGNNGAVASAATLIIDNEGEIAVQGGSWAATSLPNAITVTGSGTNAVRVLSFENGSSGTVSGPITLNADLTIGLRNWYNYATVYSGTIGGTISGAGGLKINSGTGSGGTLTLSGANTYGGGTSVSSSTLLAGSGSALGTGALNLNGGAFGSTAAATISNPITVTGANTIGHAGQANDLTLAGALTGGGTLRNYVGTTARSNLYFTGDLSGFTGTLDYTCRPGDDTQWWRVGTNNATVDLSHASVVLHVGSLTNLNVHCKSFGFRDFTTGATLKLGSLTGDGVFQAAYDNVGPNTLEVGALNTDSTFSGVLAGGNAGTKLNVRKVGAGRWTLSGNNLHTGTTSIDGGVLRVTGSIASSSAASVNRGGALEGTGAVSAISLNAGGQVSPGADGIGTLHGSSLTWNSDGATSGGLFELGTTGGASDTLALTGSLNKGSGTRFLFDFSGGMVGQTYTLLSFGSTDFTANDFGIGTASLAHGYSGAFWVDGNSVDFRVASVVPEPTSLGVIGVFAASLLTQRRRDASMIGDRW